MVWISYILISLLLFVLYIRWNDARLLAIPEHALKHTPHRCTPEDVNANSKRVEVSPLTVDDQIPPKTGRRYIVVGGAGFLGGWIVIFLLKRGEDPKRIRVLDIRAPTRRDLLEGQAAQVDYLQVDISDSDAVSKAFNKPWPSSSQSNIDPEDSEITVFHTAANIRFYERHPSLLSSSERVNVHGTQNVLNSARDIGVDTFIYTSSGSVSVHASFFLLLPFLQREPKDFVQFIDEKDELIPKTHEGFFSNYAAMKWCSEKLVRAADRSCTGQLWGEGKVARVTENELATEKDRNTGKRIHERPHEITPGEEADKYLRTGCIRPGNGVFGPGGDMLCGAYLVRRTNPTWMWNVVQSFIYVENCALAHLLYEARLLDLRNPTTGNKHKLPDIGGKSFVVSDPGPPPTYGDVYTALSTLSANECHFPSVSPTLLLLFSYLIEAYYLFRNYLLSSALAPVASCVLPALNSDLLNLQPSIFNLTLPHLLFSDALARLPPAQGGLGYRGAWTTLEGLQRTYDEHVSGRMGDSVRSGNAGIGKFMSGFATGKARAKARGNQLGGGMFSGVVRAQKVLGRMGEKVERAEERVKM